VVGTAEQVQQTGQLEACASCQTLFAPAQQVAESPWYSQRGFCSEPCGERWLDANLKDSGFPPRYRRHKLARFDPYTPELQRALEAVSTWCRCESDLGLLLVGEPGTGKTHLACGAARELCRQGFEVAYVNSPEFAMRGQDGKPCGALGAIFPDGVHALVLDDLGIELSTDLGWWVLKALVDYAYVREIKLVVTTTLDLGNFHQKYQCLGEPSSITGRILEICQAVNLVAPDYRIQIIQERNRILSGPDKGHVN